MAALVGLITLVPVWLLEFFPAQDAPNHLYSVHVQSRIHQSAIARYFVPQQGTPKSNLTFYLLALGGSHFVDLRTAHRIILSLYVLLFVAGAIFLAGSTRSERAPLGLLLSPLALSGMLTLGLYNYCLSVPLFCFAVGLMLRHPDAPWRPLVGIGLLSFAAAISHLETLGAIGLAALVLMPRGRPLLRVLVALLPAIVWVLWGLTDLGMGTYGLDWPGGFRSPWYSLVHGLSLLLVSLTAWDAPSAILMLLLLAVPSASALWRRHAEPLPRTARLTALFVALFFLLPEQSFGLFQISHRLGIFFALLVPTWADYRPLLDRPALTSGVSLALAVVATLCFLQGGRAVDRDLREFTAGASHVDRGATLLPLNFDPRAGLRVHSPLLHAWGYYGLERDIISPYFFGTERRTLSRVAARGERPIPAAPDPHLPQRLVSGGLCRDLRLALGEEARCEAHLEQTWRTLVRQACAFEQVLTWSAPTDLDGRLAPCFRPVFDQGRLRIYRRR
jgi:hypothetical protein